MDIDPTKLLEILIVLKEQGVLRARVTAEVLEVEWPAPAVQPEADVFVPHVEFDEEPSVVTALPPSLPAPAKTIPDHAPPGYGALFAQGFPSFKKATEPQR